MNVYKYNQEIVDAEALDAFLNGIGIDAPIVIYGAGGYGLKCAAHLLRVGANIRYFVDANSELWEDKPFFLNIVSPQKLKENYNHEIIIITPYKHGNDIEQNLISMGLPKNKLYQLQFVIKPFTIILPDANKKTPSELEYETNPPQNPPITVLSLIYNTPEHYLRRAIESVLSQTFKHFAYLIVDHASDDGRTSEIINEYAALDKRIMVHRTNVNFEIERQNNRDSTRAGSNLVNEIRKRVCSDYICELDSDDYYSNGFLEYAYRAIKGNKADMVCVQTIAHYECTNDKSAQMWGPILTNEIIALSDKEKWLAYSETTRPGNWWGLLADSKLFLNAILSCWSYTNGLRSDTIIAHELVKNCKTIIYTNEAYHVYTIRSTSIVNSIKILDWRYLLLHIDWSINKWLKEYIYICDKYYIDSKRFCYLTALSIANYVFYVTDNLLKHYKRQDLSVYFDKLEELLRNHYILDVIDSNKILHKRYTELSNLKSNREFIEYAYNKY